MTLVVSPSSCDCDCCCWALFLRTKLSSSCSYVLGVGSMVDEFSKMNPLPTRVLCGLSLRCLLLFWFWCFWWCCCLRVLSFVVVVVVVFGLLFYELVVFSCWELVDLHL